MPYAAGVYTVPPGTEATPLTPIDSSDYNNFVQDVEDAQNFARPVVAGGTGADNAADARTNLGAQASSAALTDLALRWTVASVSGPASLDFREDADNGTSRVRIVAPASIASDQTQTLQDITGTLYVTGGQDVSLADGGTGASLADPNADRIMFWDESAGSGGAVTWLTATNGLAISGTNLQTDPATQADQETGTNTNKPVTPGRQQYHQSACKCWGTTIGGGTPSLQSSYNVASITDNGVGLMTVTLSTAFSSASYAVTATAIDNASEGRYASAWSLATGSFQIRIFREGIGLADPATGCSWSCFGDQ